MIYNAVKDILWANKMLPLSTSTPSVSKINKWLNNGLVLEFRYFNEDKDKGFRMICITTSINDSAYTDLHISTHAMYKNRWLKINSSSFVRNLEDKIINIYPSLAEKP